MRRSFSITAPARRLVILAVIAAAFCVGSLATSADAHASECWVQSDINTGDRTQYCYIDWNWGWRSDIYYEEYQATQYGGAYLFRHRLFKYFYAGHGQWIPWFCMSDGGGSSYRLVSCPF